MSRNSLSSPLLLTGFPCPGMMMVLSVIAARLASDAAIMPSMPGWLAVPAGEHDAGEYLTMLAGRLWAQIGIACQKPLHRAVERDESLVRQWLKKEYPKIKAMAKKTRGGHLFRRRGAHPLRSSRGADMGDERRHAHRPSDGRSPWHESDFGGHLARPPATVKSRGGERCGKGGT